jgi:succinyl-CoA synthetase alpha subunit
MSILIDATTRLLIQGITGKEGMRALEWAQAYGTAVLAGVTPGKGGQEVNGVPVYNSVAEACAAHPEINASTIYAPPRFVKSAALEALEAHIPLLHVIAEEVPVRDTVEMLQSAQRHKARIVGPSSIGIISPGKAKLGSIGGDDNQQFAPGSIGVISKSGGMSSEISLLLTKNGYGQSTVLGVGGNVISCTTFADLVELFEADEQTQAVVIIGEIGGAYEEKLAEKLASLPQHKPYVAFISGLFAETLPQGMSFGHAGAIVDKNIGTRQGKIHALQTAGVQIAEEPSAIIKLLNKHVQPDFVAEERIQG